MVTNSELHTLIELQELDLKIVELQEKQEEAPRKIEVLDQTLDASRQTFQESARNIEENNRRSRQLEGEVELLRERLSKYKTQLMEVKTNKEYQAMIHEIEGTEQEIRLKEDQVLEGMMAVDEWEKKLLQMRHELEKEERGTAAKRQELERFASQFQEEIAKLQQKRPQLLEEVPGQLIEQYQKIASARSGMALAEARNQSCQACHVKLRPQLFNDVKTNRFIITCESCNRILYYPGP